MRTVVISLVLLAPVLGCNQIFDLEPTSPAPLVPPVDDDHDDIEDSTDNCPLLYNPLQEDDDDDGIGNLCDQCADCEICEIGPAHDEDGDRLADGCDNCPAVANPTQANGDGDDLGDACDASTATQRRVFFDGFGVLDPAWVGNTLWQSNNDSLEPRPGQIPTFDGYRITNRQTQVVAGPWSVEVGIDLPALPVQGKFVGFRLLVPSNQSGFWFCTFMSTTTGWSLSNGPNAPTAATGSVVLRNSSAGTVPSEENVCEVPGDAQVRSTVNNDPYPRSPQLWTTVESSYRYLEIIQ